MNEPTFDYDPRPLPADSIQTKFEHFHRRNPEVYRQLVILAYKARGYGQDTIGIGMLFEVLRWNWYSARLPDEHEHYKLSNNYRSRYARLIMEQEPALAGAFNTKPLTAL